MSQEGTLMLIALSIIIGYLAIVIVVGAVVRRLPPDWPNNNNAPHFALFCCALWLIALAAAAVAGIGACLFLLIEWVAVIPESAGGTDESRP